MIVIIAITKQNLMLIFHTLNDNAFKLEKMISKTKLKLIKNFDF
jgi:hypothetical protein